MVKIPTRLEELIPAAAMEKVLNALSQPDIPASVRDALSKFGWKDSNPLGQVQDAWLQAKSWLDSVTNPGSKIDRSITLLNATGMLIDGTMGGVPMPASVAYGFAKAATSFQSDGNLRAKAQGVAQSLFGQPAVWIHSPAMAVRLLSHPILAPAGLVISRADAVRVPGFGDVRAMLTSWGGQIIEVGAANGATAQDWEQSLAPNQLLVLVSPNNLSTSEAAAQRDAALTVARRVGVAVAELLIDGAVNESLSQTVGFPHVRQRLEDERVDMLLVPTHLLLAGPTGMLAIGDTTRIGALESAVAAQGGLMSGPNLAAATLAVQLASLSDSLETGLPALLLANPDNLKNRARRLAIQLNDTPHIREAVEIERSCALGGTPWDRTELRNWGIRLTPRHSVDQLRKLLANEEPSASGRIPLLTARNGEHLIIDLRFIAPEDDHEIVTAGGAQPQKNAEASPAAEEHTP